MNVTIFDVEGDSLTPTKLHVMSYHQDGVLKSVHKYDDIREVLVNADILLGHHITMFDIPVVERLLNIKIKARLIDTLAISWYLYPKRIKHGLDDWGEEFGVPKPKIDDWANLPVEEYTHRCEEDVKITLKLWEKIVKDLTKLYGNWNCANRLIHYLQFKMDCAAEQERSRWKLDEELVHNTLDKLIDEREAKLPALIAAMPKVPIFKDHNPPKKPYKKDGTLSVTGAKWNNLLEKEGLQATHNKCVTVLSDYKEPNPGSHVQVKQWLFGLDWSPQNFKFDRNKDTGNIRKIPQLKAEANDGTLCPSVLELCKKEPSIKLLEGMGIINHRISFLEGMVKNCKDGYVYAGIAGFTNTLRFKHKAPLANIPKVSMPYGKEIRGSLIAREGYELCGSDQVSLEDRTKLHYMFKYDPDYVKEMSVDGFDPHLDLAIVHGRLTPEQAQAHKDGVEDYGDLRHSYKTTNYTCTYGAKAATIARSANCSEQEGQELYDVYWKRNWAILKIAEDVTVKTVNGQMWLYNPVSTFWYSLRYKKDIFSTLNQGTGVYAFDTWVKYVRSRRPQLTAQFHDEIVLEIKKGAREKCKELLHWALDKTNKRLMLNRQLDISVDFGDRYSEIH